MTDNDHDWWNERVIGHILCANEETHEDDPVRASLEKAAADLDMELNHDTFIRIKEGDISWDESRELRVTTEELAEMAATFCTEEEITAALENA